MRVWLSIVTFPVLVRGGKTCLGKKHEDGSLIDNETLLASRSQHLCPQNELPCTYTAQEKKEGPDDNGRGC